MFDFKCTSCDEVHEALVNSDVEEQECPKCGKKSTRIFTQRRVSFQFNWFEEDRA